MNRKIIIAGALVLTIAGASAVAFAGIGRGVLSSEAPAAANANRPVQTLLSQFQAENAARNPAQPIARIAPATAAESPSPAGLRARGRTRHG